MNSDKRQQRKSIRDRLIRQDIIEGALSVLKCHGIQGMTMHRVARQACVGKGTLYVCFKNKDEILNAAVEASFEPLRKEVNLLLYDDNTPDAKLIEFARRSLRFFDENPWVIGVLLYDRDMGRSGKNRCELRYRTPVQLVKDILDEGSRQGLFASLDSTKAAAMFLEIIVGVFILGVHVGKSIDVEKGARQVSDIFMNGLRREK